MLHTEEMGLFQMWATDSLGIRSNTRKWLTRIVESSKMLVLSLNLHGTCNFIMSVLMETDDQWFQLCEKVFKSSFNLLLVADDRRILMIPKCLFTEELLVIWRWLIHLSEACLSYKKILPEISLHRNELFIFPPKCFNVQGLVGTVQFHMEKYIQCLL